MTYEQTVRSIKKTGGLSRRGFLKAGLATVAATAFPALSWAHLHSSAQERRLSFYHTHTGEALTVCYFRDGEYCPRALSKISYLMRDHYNGEVISIDTGLLDVLHRVADRIRIDAPFHVISGYRSPHTNARLRRKSKGVASRSLHMLGKAVDIRVPGLRTAVLRKTAVKLKAGGVGYYPQSDFVHLDTGRVRCW